METVKDYSFGVVPIYKKENEWQVLLVHQISYRGDSFWTLPKGHAENNETPETTALRELEEETGISQVTILPSNEFVMEYSFVHEGKQIDKKVTFFLGYVSNPEITLTLPNEISDSGWYSLNEAIAVATHTEVKRILQELDVLLKQLNFDVM